jgi:carboxymethylenebutenolidase
MTGKLIDVTASDGKKFHAYLALPSSKKAPGILLIQEIFGVNHHIKSVADKWAKEGFVVLAPDLFFRMQPDFEVGYGEEDMKKAFELYHRFDEKQALDDLSCALESLRKLPECTGKLGVIGFCLGGKMTYRVAAHNKIDAASSYYGGGINQMLDEMPQIACPMLMHFGAKDQHITSDAVDAIKKAAQSKTNIQIFVYDADHGFNCDERKSYDKASADLAFTRSLDLMKTHLE